MAPGLILKWNLGPVQPPWEEIIILSISLWTISRQLVRKHCKDATDHIQFTYRQFWCMPSGSSGFQWCSRRRTGTSTGPDQRSSPLAAWWCQLSPAWPAALQSKHRKSRHAVASAGHLSCDGRWGNKRSKTAVSKKESEDGKMNSQLHFEHTWNQNWPSNLEALCERKQAQTGNYIKNRALVNWRKWEESLAAILCIIWTLLEEQQLGSMC